jgi:hypothetical protein
MAKPLRFEVERVPFSVDQNKSYFLRLAGNSKALIYGRPQSQFSGELFTTLAPVPFCADTGSAGAAAPISSETMATGLDAVRLLFCRIKKQKQISGSILSENGIADPGGTPPVVETKTHSKALRHTPNFF